MYSNCYCVSYDLQKPGQHYDRVYDQIKKSSGYLHCLESTWLIATNENADQVTDRLHKAMDSNDLLLVIRVRRDFSGWLPETAWQWIRSHVPNT